jgi:hypothetical protein
LPSADAPVESPNINFAVSVLMIDSSPRCCSMRSNIRPATSCMPMAVKYPASAMP